MPIAVCGLLSAHPGYDCSDWSGIEVASIDILRIEKMDGTIVQYIPNRPCADGGRSSVALIQFGKMLKIGNFRYQRFLVAEIQAKVTPSPKLQVSAFKLTSIGLGNAFDLLRIYQIAGEFRPPRSYLTLLRLEPKRTVSRMVISR